jgi:serine/threonine protein phosphatase PrpC
LSAGKTGEIRVTIGQSSSAGRKERNDDSYGVAVPETALLATKGVAMAIADGMSTSEAAKTASETAIRGFLGDYFGTHQSWAVKTSVSRVLTALNRWLHSQSLSRYGAEDAMVTTFSGLILKGGTGYLFHAGDSRIALLREGSLEILTQNHTVKDGRGRETLTRALGKQSDLTMDYRELPIEDGDTLIFTTDGVHEHVSAAAILDQVAALRHDPNAAAAAICAAALAAGSPDNLTCQIVHIDCAGKLDSFTLTERLRTLPFAPDLKPGTVFEGLKVLREVHASARSQVYLVEEETTGKRMALKTPSPNFEGDEDYIRQFIREEWVGQLIASPHVLKVLSITRARRYLYTLSDYVEGQTLASLMKHHPNQPVNTVRGIVEQIVKGLRAFHRHDILHQDLKPDNIMIDRSGVVKIIDFGSVRIAGLEELGSGKPALLGTRDYIAPEYLAGEQPTPRSDLFSLGVIAYEMFTGKLPYGQGFATAKDIQKARYIPANEVNPDIPAWVDFALAKAVALRPSQRYEALSHFLADLTKPGEAFQHRRKTPSLIERNPRAVLRMALFVSVMANMALLALLLLRGRGG